MKKNNNVRYLCVDDEPNIESTRRRLAAGGQLTIELRRPVADWTAEVDAIHRAMTVEKYSGLLIDFRLDETHQGLKSKGTDGKVVRYTAESLVSELRRRSVEGGKDESYPIVLWSTAKFLKRFYELNPGYLVSYDSIWDKEQLAGDMAGYRQRLTSLNRGYQQLAVAVQRGKVDMPTLLAAAGMSVLTEFDQFMRQRAHGTPYVFQYALFIAHDVLEVGGPLIDAATVRAFLGVEKMAEKDWVTILAALGKEVIYRGIFADAYERYWRDNILRALETLTGAASWLSLPAAERAALLRRHFKRAKIEPAKPMGKDYATDYDCVCAVTKKPLAKRNGYRLLNTRSLRWKEPEYVAGVTYRLKYAELSKTLPLEAEDKERFAAQYGLKPRSV